MTNHFAALAEALPLLPLGQDLSRCTADKLTSLLAAHKLSPDEYASILTLLGRAPTWTELGIFSAMWSEHCSYKSSKKHLARLPTAGKDVVVGPGENAGVVRLAGKLCVAFKMESHNHPSFIDPYQGAATGLGGILRDVFCMGARPLCNLNALRFGEPQLPTTPWLLAGVVAGIGDYGNCVGVPTVGGSLSFDASYNGNILVNAMTVGLIHEDKIFKGRATGAGNLVIYVGSATGRDGIHGATMASDSFASQAAQERHAVQVGDPFYEKLLMEATLEALGANLVEGIQDMGAAGLASSLFEMADRGQSGLLIDLDQVPTRSAGMSAYELFLSESQERMVMVVQAQHWLQLQEIFRKWQLSYGVLGEVTETGRVQAFYQGKREVDVPVAPLATLAPRYDRPMQAPASRAVKSQPGQWGEQDPFTRYCLEQAAPHSLTALLAGVLRASGDRSWLYQQYDHHIGNKTRLGPEEQGASVLWIPDPEGSSSPLGLAVATAGQEKLCRLDPCWGAAYSVLKAARMIAACGGEALAVTDCLNYGNPENPEVMWQFSQGIDGIKLACEHLQIPVVSGNVSLYNETDGKSISPSPMIGMVGRLADLSQALPARSPSPGELWLLTPRDSCKQGFWLGGSLLAQYLHLPLDDAAIPEPAWEAEAEAMALLRRLGRQQVLLAARDVGEAGLLATAVKMVLDNDLGLHLRGLGSHPDLPADPRLSYFGLRSATYLLLGRSEDCNTLRREAEALSHCLLLPVGEVLTAPGRLYLDGQELSPELLRSAYCSALTSILEGPHDSR